MAITNPDFTGSMSPSSLELLSLQVSSPAASLLGRFPWVPRFRGTTILPGSSKALWKSPFFGGGTFFLRSHHPLGFGCVASSPLKVSLRFSKAPQSPTGSFCHACSQRRRATGSWMRRVITRAVRTQDLAACVPHAVSHFDDSPGAPSATATEGTNDLHARGRQCTAASTPSCDPSSPLSSASTARVRPEHSM